MRHFNSGSIVGFFLWRHDRRARLIWVGAIFSVAGALWFTVRSPRFDQNSLATYNNIGNVTIDGVIEADPDIRDTYINLRVNADQITLPDKSVRPIEGTLLARPARPAEFRYGDRVRVAGELNTPPEFAPFNYADYLARQDVYSLIDRPPVKVLAHDQGCPILSVIAACNTNSALSDCPRVLKVPLQQEEHEIEGDGNHNEQDARDA